MTIRLLNVTIRLRIYYTFLRKYFIRINIYINSKINQTCECNNYLSRNNFFSKSSYHDCIYNKKKNEYVILTHKKLLLKNCKKNFVPQ